MCHSIYKQMFLSSTYKPFQYLISSLHISSLHTRKWLVQVSQLENARAQAFALIFTLKIQWFLPQSQSSLTSSSKLSPGAWKAKGTPLVGACSGCDGDQGVWEQCHPPKGMATIQLRPLFAPEKWGPVCSTAWFLTEVRNPNFYVNCSIFKC